MPTAYGIDAEHIRRLVREEIAAGCTNASEIAGHVARVIADEEAHGDPCARTTLLGLAALGVTAYARSALKENKLRVTRRGAVTTISGGYALPGSVVRNGAGTVPDVDEEPSDRSEYVQFDLMTWDQFRRTLEALRSRRGALDATIVTFEEIAKLEAQYPELSVGDAICAAGLDLAGRAIDLDSLNLAV